jgi:hypothetical protein
MALGLLIAVSGVFSSARSVDLFTLVASLLIGGAWFAFGKYGGIPLVETVAGWRPPGVSTEITASHRDGLLLMRRRRWAIWAVIPGILGISALVIHSGSRVRPEMFVLAAVPLAVINFRYFLSRCPRCGYGFFTRSRSRAASLRLTNECGHCGLSLNGYRQR